MPLALTRSKWSHVTGGRQAVRAAWSVASVERLRTEFGRMTSGRPSHSPVRDVIRDEISDVSHR